MKILHLNDFFYPHVAGPAKHMADVMRFTFQPENHIAVSFDYNKSLKREENYNGIPHFRYNPIGENDYHRFMNLNMEKCHNLSKFVSFVRGIKPTCICLYFFGYLPSIMCKKLPEMNVVFMTFGYRDGDYHHLYRTRRFKIALCGDGYADQYIDAGANTDQISVIERPINTNHYTPLNVERNPYRLLCVSRYDPVKRLPNMIRMLVPLFREYSKLHIHIVADTENTSFTGVCGDELDKVRMVIKEYDISERVILRGRCVGKDLLREYSEASIHLLASNLDRRATVVQEAITMGLQCVNTCKHVYDWPEFSQDGKRLIHYVDEIEDMAQAIRNLLEAPSLSSNRDYAIKEWSWHRWKPIYERLISEW